MAQDEELTIEPVYLALSRPPTWLGVPLDAALLIAMAAVLALLFANPLYGFAVAIVGFGIARLIVRQRAQRLPAAEPGDADEVGEPRSQPLGR